MAEQQRAEKSIFLAAVEIDSDAERAAYVEQACACKPQLFAEVKALLRAHGKPQPFLDTPPTRGPTIDQQISEAAGAVIGPYKLLEQIGEGGFGVVFMAEQTEPVRRKVALKVLKPGMDTRQVVARFEAERQALAIMDHPNIAKVFNGAATPSGRPYFVMELVKGVPITEFCDQNQLTPRQRLELFMSVCQAVQHAHQKGIIHRDLKPSNILVVLHDATPVPKVIDFGVAKALGQELTDKTLFTGFTQMIGTPLYMSPEQAGQSGLDIDTRSDIYSLGVLLYELLTGTTPFPKERFQQAGYDEIRRIIREEEPPRPSTRLLESKDTLASISAQRHTEPAKLTKLVRGELDWIVMKGLEKDRNRRYETANGFAMDVQRYLADEPVLACPPSTGYRFKKFLRRNKGPVWAGAIVLLALLVGMVGTAIGLAREQQAKRQAEEREAETTAVLQFIEKHVIAAARPEDQDGGLGHDVTLRRALETALPFVDKSFAGQPLIEARVRFTLGQSFLYLGEARIAAEQFSKARALFAEHRGLDHPDTLASMNNLANSYQGLGRDAEACKLHEETLALWKANFGHDHPETLGSMNNLANSYYDLGRYADALNLHEETWALRKATLGHDHLHTLQSMANVANNYAALSRHADALKLRKELLALMKAKRGREHPDTLQSMSSLASSYEDFSRYADALKLREEVLELAKAKLGADHAVTLRSRSSLASSYATLDRHTEALELRELVLELTKARLGPEHPATLMSMSRLADSYADVDRLRDACKLGKETLALQKARLGPDHRDTLGTMHNLANFYGNLDRQTEALKLREETLALRKAKLGPHHPDTLQSMSSLASSYAHLDRHDDALKLLEEVLALWKSALGPNHEDTLATMSNLALSYEAVGRHPEALKLREETLALCNAKLPPNHRHTLASMHNLALSYDRVKRNEEAHKLRGEGRMLMEAKFGPHHRDTLRSKSILADSYAALKRHKEALKLREEVLPLMKARLGPDHRETLESMRDLAASYAALKLHKEALKLREELLPLMKAKYLPDHPETLRNMSNLAGCYTALDRHDDSVKLLTEVLAVRKANLGPDHADTLRSIKNLAEAWYWLGAAVYKNKGLPAAVDAWKTAVAIDPKYADAWNDLGTALAASKDLPGAIKAFKEALAINHQDADAWFNLGLALSNSKDLPGAIDAYENCVAIDDKDATHLNALAWLLATCSDAKLRNPSRAVALAEKAVELASTNAGYANTLGVAHYRAGDCKAAIATLEKAESLRKAGHANDWLFLAMAHWKLGEKGKARERYDRAVQWMDKNPLTDEELRYFRAEAAELLGVKDKKD